MQGRVGDEDVGRLRRPRLAREVGDGAPGLGGDQHSCGRVPGLQRELPEPVGLTARDAAAVDGGGSVATHAVDVADQPGEHRQLPVQGRTAIVGEARDQQRRADGGGRAAVDRHSITEGAASVRGAEQLVARRVENGPHVRTPAPQAGHGDAVAGVAVDVAGGAVERVYHPDLVVGRRSGLHAGEPVDLGLLDDEAGERKGVRDGAGDGDTGCDVDLGDQVALGALRAHVLDPARVLTQDRGARRSRRSRDLQTVVHFRPLSSSGSRRAASGILLQSGQSSVAPRGA